MNEESLIPYEMTDLTGGRILVLAAHPDDEVLGAGGTIALNVGRAEAVRIWIATDGAGQEGIDPADARAYGVRRREEARRAAESLGLEPPRFGSLPDRELSKRSGELATLVGALIEEFRPDLVFCPSPVEIHPDHRALAEALYDRAAASRPADSDHDRFRFLRLAFYEISHPLLPNALVDISSVAERKEKAVQAYASQQAVRDYGGALAGLNAYRRLTLPGRGPVEAFRVVPYAEVCTRSLEEFRRSIGPAVVADNSRGPAPVTVVVRTRNRPALLREALESLRAQTARPAQVVVVNDGGASLAEIPRAFRDAFAIEPVELPRRQGRAAAANRGLAAATQELVTFLDDDDRCYPDHLERLVRAHRSGPEPVVYSDAVTVVYRRKGEVWETRQRTLQYSLDFDADFLLLANYIPLHTLLASRALCAKAGAFDERFEYSEDWDFLIRLSFESSFRHVRAVTCEYRIFEESDGDPQHEAAGAPAFQQARREIYARYAVRRSEEGLARALDRLRAQASFWYDRDGISQGELLYQRESHRRLHAALGKVEQRASRADSELARIEGERARAKEIAEARLAEALASRQSAERQFSESQTEIERLNAILRQIYASRTWKLHLLLDRLRGRR